MSTKTQQSLACTTVFACIIQCASFGLSSSSVEAQTTSPFERTASGSAGNWQHFTIEIPAGTASLNVDLSGGTGDADLYVRFGEEPTNDAFDCRPYIDGNGETCTNTNPQAGIWHISINAFTDYSDVTLKATWVATPEPMVMPTPTPTEPMAMPTPTEPMTTPAPIADWKTQILEKHNFYRAQHCAPPLTWDDEIAQSAQGWADGCVFTHDGVAGTGFGENLAGGIPGENASSAVDMWYNEISKYDFAAPGFSLETGHFTQVVWRGSTKIGCGMAMCPGSIFGWAPEFGNALMYSCRYSASGNSGAYTENVKPQGAVCE